MLQFEHVSLAYGSQQILHDLCFQIPDGQMTVLIGPSGCGKTTTLKMINRLIEPTSGKIYLDGEDIATKNKVDLRRHIGYVIQQIGLFPNMTVAQNICVVPTLLKYSKEECDRIARHLWRWSISPMSSTPINTPARCPAVSSSASASSGHWLPRPPSS